MEHTKYTCLGQALRTALPSMRGEQLNFVIGIQGTIEEELWMYQLECLPRQGAAHSQQARENQSSAALPHTVHCDLPRRGLLQVAFFAEDSQERLPLQAKRTSG